MSKILPTRRSKASARSSVARDDESGEGPAQQYPDPPLLPPGGDGDLRPDPQIDLGGLEWDGTPGDAEPESRRKRRT
jgi:hypothetical protein